MRSMFVAILILFPLAGAARAENAVIADAVTGFVEPAYSRFKEAAETTQRSVKALCDSPAPQSLADAQERFRSLSRAWSEVEIIRFGPITEENRLERVLFWPDRKGIGLKQVQTALTAEDATAAAPLQLAGKSVAMQGLGALEFLLFGTGNEGLAAAKGYRCTYALAVATNVAAIATAVATAWTAPGGFAHDWANPAPTNAFYTTEDAAMTELFEVFVHGLEQVRDVRLSGFLGETASEDKPKQGVFWRSDSTATSLAANVDGLKALFDAADFGRLLPADAQWIVQSADFEFANARAAFEKAGSPLAEALADPDRRGKFDYARLVTSSLSETFGVRLAGALGLSAGFSSLDGD